MSHRSRVIVGVIAGILWGSWVTLHLANPGGAGNAPFVLEILRTSATLLTSVWAVSWIVGPLVNSAQLWREIGRREAQDEGGKCSCSRANNLIPITYVGELARAKRASSASSRLDGWSNRVDTR